VSIFPTKILLATDGSEEAELALRMAVELANSTDSELHVLSVGMPDLPDYVELLEEAYRRFERRGQQTLTEQVKKVEEAGGIVVKAHFTMEGPPGQEIVHFAERLDAGMIVMGSRGLGGLRRALLGSASDSVVRHAHCPVMVVRKEEKSARL
jgi:nucleotide-binding universal stress UspA family protein